MNTVALALRNLGRRRRRTLLTASGVVASVGFIVFITALMDGFVRFIVHQSVDTDIGAIQIHSADYATASAPLDASIADDPALMRSITAVPGVRALSPRIRFDGMLNNGVEAAAIWLFAYDPPREHAVCTGRREIESVSLVGQPEDAVLLGEAMAASLGLKVGDQATLQVTAKGGRSNALTVTVAGLITSRVPLQVKSVGVVQLGFARRLLDLGAAETEIAVAVDPLERLPSVTAALRKTLGARYTVSTWQTLDPVGMTAINQTRVIISIIILVLYALAILGVMNTMTLSVHERVREIGTMLAVGMRRKRLLALFVSEAALLALAASLVGVVAGSIVSRIVAIDGMAFEVPDSPPVVIRPVLESGSLLTATAIILVATVFAAFWPAARAARLTPVEALANR